MSRNRYAIVQSSLVFALAIGAGACTIDKSSSPAVSAPSATGLSVTPSASPDTLPRDGHSTSQVRFVVTDYLGKGVKDQRLSLSATAGTLSAGLVTTDASGNAVVQFTAPDAISGVNSVTVTATPIGADPTTVTSLSRTVHIALLGASIPVPSFTWSPESPAQFDLALFDATGTMLNGANCLDACTYTWDFGDGSSGSGRMVGHRFSIQGLAVVRLTVANSAGDAVSTTRSVVVGPGAAITADITQSPTNAIAGQTIYFDAAGSTTPDGTAIVSWAWDFGNGSTATTRQATVVFAAPQTYTVRLTITDALGRTATTTKTVTVS